MDQNMEILGIEALAQYNYALVVDFLIHIDVNNLTTLSMGKIFHVLNRWKNVVETEKTLSVVILNEYVVSISEAWYAKVRKENLKIGCCQNWLFWLVDKW